MAQFKVRGILSYPHLFQARAMQQGDDPKFSTSVLIRKDDPQVAQVQTLVEQEKANGFPQGFPPTGKVNFKDGAVVYPQDTRMHNYWIMSFTAKADQKPTVVDSNMQPVMDPALVYPGAIAWVSGNTFSYNQPMSKGVSAGLNGVMITGEEGELGRLDNRPTVEGMFGDVADGAAPAAAAPAAAPAAAAPAAAPAAAAPAAAAPAAAPAAAAPAAPAHQMLPPANGATYEQMIIAGWTDETLIQYGMMAPPASFQ